MGDKRDNGPLNGWRPEEVLDEWRQQQRFRDMDETMVGVEDKQDVITLKDISQVTSFDQLMKLIENANYLQLPKRGENTTMSENTATVKRVLQQMDKEVEAQARDAKAKGQLGTFWSYVETYKPTAEADFLHSRVTVIDENMENESMRLDKFVLNLLALKYSVPTRPNTL